MPRSPRCAAAVVACVAALACMAAAGEAFDCHDVFSPDGDTFPPAGALADFVGRTPLTYSEWHPNVASLEAHVFHNCLLSQELSRARLANVLPQVDLMTLDKITANASWAYEVEYSKKLHGRRRSFSATSFADGMAGALKNQGTSDMINALTGGVWDCYNGVKNVAITLYNLFAKKSFEVVSAVKNLAGLIKDCASAASTFTPFSLVKGALTVVKAVYHAADITKACGGLYRAMKASQFNSYNVGKAAGECVLALADVFSRRRRGLIRDGAVTIPEAWSCDGVYYNASDGCDLACGAYDPDCSDPASPAMFPNETFHNQRHSPEAWTCPAMYYNGSDGCDVGCGVVDPDCERQAAAAGHSRREPEPLRSGVDINWGTPQSTFAVKVGKEMDMQLHVLSIEEHPEIATESGTTSGGLSSRDIGLIVGGTIAGAILACVVMLLIARRARQQGRRRAQEEGLDYQLLNTDGQQQ